MNGKQKNWLSMIFAVTAFFDKYLDLFIGSSSALGDYVSNLIKIRDDIIERDGDTMGGVDGWTADKKSKLGIMAVAALIVSRGLQAYFNSIGDDSLAKQAKLTKTSFKKGAASNKLYLAQTLLELAQKYDEEIEPFGVKADKLLALSQGVAAFKASLGQPLIQKDLIVKAGEDVDKLFVDVFEVLSQIDLIMGTHITEFSLECDIYEGVRQNPNYRSGKRIAPDKILTLKAHEKKVVLTGEFEIFKRIRVKNNGKGWLNWGKTSKADTFTGKFFISDAGKVSFYKVKTLGEDGTMILFENPNNFPVEIEVTVLDK